ncbi:hypothetical protein HAX54_034498 [Datura stramonium]|uniref:Uncharacterized protein n=1 Tax=Datura stramonium TaxID=4076 RepID=A0ABS8VH58_DATST|nr:hypothetical protein [Datura stramonium]
MAGKRGRGQPRKQSINATSLLNFTLSGSKNRSSVVTQGQAEDENSATIRRPSTGQPSGSPDPQLRPTGFSPQLNLSIPQGHDANPKAQNEPKRKKVMKQVWQPKEANPNGEGVQGAISSIETKESPKVGVLEQQEVPWHVVKRYSINVTPTRSACVETLL